MKRNQFKLINTTFFLVLTFWQQSCSRSIDAVTGNNMAQSDNRVTEPFSRIVVKGNIQLRLSVPGPQTLAVRARRDVVRQIKTDVRDGTLHVSLSGIVAVGGEQIVTASMPELLGIEATDNSETTIDVRDGSNLDLVAKDNARMIVRGNGQHLNIKTGDNASIDRSNYDDGGN